MNLLEETASGIKAINEDLESNESILSVLNVEYDKVLLVTSTKK